MAATAHKAESQTWAVRPNAGAQSTFLRSAEKFPAFVSGQWGGKSWAGARKLLLGAMQWPGTDSLVVEPTHSEIAQVAIPEICKALDEAGLRYEVKRSAPAEITMPQLRSKIMFHSGLHPERITGFSVARAWIDEPARIPGNPIPARDCWSNVMGRLRWEGLDERFLQAWCTGTHEGKGSWFYRDWEKKPKPGHVIYRGSTVENPIAREYEARLRAEYGDELARQYLEGWAVEDGQSAIKWQDIQACQDAACPREPEWSNLYHDATPLFVGIDIGRSESLTVIWIFQQRGGVLRTVGVVEARDTPFADQEELIGKVLSLPGFTKCAIDATYNPGTAEAIVSRFGEYAVEAVVFNRTVKIELVESLAKATQQRTIRIPADDDIALDWYSMRRKVTGRGVVTYEAPMRPDGHADRCCAAALALRAAKGGAPRMEGYTAPALVSAGFRSW